MFLGTRWNMQVNDLSRCWINDLDLFLLKVSFFGISWSFLPLHAGLSCRSGLLGTQLFRFWLPEKKDMKHFKSHLQWREEKESGWHQGIVVEQKVFFEFYETKKLEEMIQFDEHICFKWFFAPLRRNPVNITLTFSDGVFRWILLCIIDTVKVVRMQFLANPICEMPGFRNNFDG